MYQDALLTFSSAQAVTATAASTSHVDLGQVRNIGVGENLYVVCVCTVAMTDAGFVLYFSHKSFTYSSNVRRMCEK